MEERYLTSLYLMVLVCIADGVIQRLRLDCKTGSMPGIGFGRYLPFILNISNSHNSSIIISSPCCNHVTMENARCSACAADGKKECFLEVDESVTISYEQEVSKICRNATNVTTVCFSQKCNDMDINGNGYKYNPGEEIGCSGEQRARCMPNGTWSRPETCFPGLSTGFPNNVSELYETTDGYTEEITPQPSVSVPASTIDAADKGTIPNATTPTSKPFDKEKAMKDLYVFLIAFGVALLLAFVLVCAFFIRKRRSGKPPVGNYPLEYWHDRDYIDSVVDRGFCPKHSFTVNPVYESSEQPDQRYRRKDEPVYRYSREDQEESTPTNSAKPVCTISNIRKDGPLRTRRDYDDEYIATAAGSNFYSYRRSPDVDLGEPNDNAMVERSPSLRRGSKIYPNKTMYRQQKHAKKHQKAREYEDNYGSNDDETKDAEPDDNYAMSYKRRLQRHLDTWSAEESDV